MVATLIILLIWLAFVWFYDPDGFGDRVKQRHPQDAQSPLGEDHRAVLGRSADVFQQTPGLDRPWIEKSSSSGTASFRSLAKTLEVGYVS